MLTFSVTGIMYLALSSGGLQPIVLGPFALVWGGIVFTRRLRLAYHLVFAVLGGLLLSFPPIAILNSIDDTLRPLSPDDVLSVQHWVTGQPIVFLKACLIFISLLVLGAYLVRPLRRLKED